MKKSLFNVVAQKTGEKRCLLYNTFHDSQILCDDKDETEKFFNKIENHEDLNPEEQELAETFQELGFLLDDATDEKDEFLDWFETKVRNNHERLSHLILTSRTCNLRCPYCFEKDVLGQGLNMTDKTATQVISWIQGRVEQHRPKKVDISFFGGEPLMNIPVLKKIASAISSLCKSYDAEFECGIITNGVLLTPELVLELKTYGLRWIKITLDGDKHDHDKLRITASGKGTFDKIWGNLEKVKGLIPIYLGGNFDASNQDGLKNLVDKIDKAGFRDNVFSMEFKPIYQRLDLHQPHDRPIRTDLAEPAFSPEQVEVMKGIRNYIQKKELPTNNQVGIGPCELHRKSFYGIDMDGDLYKCSAMVGRKDFASGNIWAGPDEGKVQERMGTGIRPWKDCEGCPFIPVCAGGCKALGYNKTGDFTVGTCDKIFFKAMVQEMFERNLKETVSYDDGLQFEKVSLPGVLTASPSAMDEVPGDSEGVRSFAV